MPQKKKPEPHPFAPHLHELRKRAFIVLSFFVAASSVSLYYVQMILRVLKMPAQGTVGKLAVFSPTEAFLSFFKIALVSGFILSVPVLLYEAWIFALPALKKSHAKNGWWLIAAGTALFAFGSLFAFFLLIPASVRFLMNIGRDELEFLISLDSYITFVLALILGTGLVFQMPVLVFVLSKAGLLTPEKMLAGWRQAIVAILTAAAFITPTPDIFNMVLIAIPMFALYLVSVGVSKISQ